MISVEDGYSKKLLLHKRKLMMSDIITKKVDRKTYGEADFRCELDELDDFIELNLTS